MLVHARIINATTAADFALMPRMTRGSCNGSGPKMTDGSCIGINQIGVEGLDEKSGRDWSIPG